MRDAHYAITIRTPTHTIVDVDDFVVTDGAITFLFGESGIGKSMICRTLFGLLDPGDFQVTVNGRSYHDHLSDPATRAIREGGFFVFQEPSSHLNPLMRIEEQLREGDLTKGNLEESLGRLWEGSSPQKLQSLMPVYPKAYRPSGGEKQRLLLAMAFMKNGLLKAESSSRPSLFVYDEPTGSLDNTYRNLFLAYLYERHAVRPATTIVITHDYSIISEICGRHKSLIGSTRFRELVRTGKGGVTIRDFSPDKYLSWLETAAPGHAETRNRKIVLSFTSRFSIFGRDHAIFRDSDRTEEADLVIRGGEMAYVKAPSGTGKTTLAKIIMGLYSARKFSMTLGDRRFDEFTPRRVWEKDVWGRRAGMVFQHADEALDLEATVRETFSGLPLDEKLSDESLIGHLQGMFDGTVTESFLGKKVKHLSGGQKQRLNLLRTLILSPALIILDEPLNGLDFDSSKKIMALLEKRRREGAALLMISHNEEIFDAIVTPENIYHLGECAPAAGNRH